VRLARRPDLVDSSIKRHEDQLVADLDAADRREFGMALRRWREVRGLSTLQLARALEDRGRGVTPANVSAWELGKYAPRSREIVVVLEEILDAPGELLPILGWAVGPSVEDRLAAVEEELQELVQLVQRLLRNRPRSRRA
jgi:transcriptional regulator with XRE-family HTH domain